LERTKIPQLFKKGERDCRFEACEDAGGGSQSRDTSSDNGDTANRPLADPMKLPEGPNQIVRSQLLFINGQPALQAAEQIQSGGHPIRRLDFGSSGHIICG
jgi:hypothetical protein